MTLQVNLTPDEIEAIRALADAAREAYAQAGVMRMAQVNALRSDMTMQRLHTAVQAVDKITFKPTRKGKYANVDHGR